MAAHHLILHIRVGVNWQLSKQGSHWPVAQVSTHRGYMLKFPADKLYKKNLLVFNWLQAHFQVDFFEMVTRFLFEVKKIY